ncbi:MAG: tRNA preQ1(34) S-adenosylmethionine ribosyltransferase-isomerase QueA [Desulfobacterales bacterium]
MFSLNEYKYELPESAIAQVPADQRDQSRLLFLARDSGNISHHRFSDLCGLLSPDDVLVINDTKVIPGRLLGKKATGGKVEVLLLRRIDADETGIPPGSILYQCLVRASKGPKPGAHLFFDQGLKGEIVTVGEGVSTIRFVFDGDFDSLLDQIGNVPLPPYIRRQEGHNKGDDRTAYQTVYASQKGAIAAPTAGLHFTEALLDAIRAKPVKIVAITLHVGYGTFLPVRSLDIRDHKIHTEAYHISKESAETINAAKADGRRIVVVGTTCVRTLEYASDSRGRVVSGSGECDLFIYPGYRFNIVDALITNFHLPQSTLLMLVAAFAGRERVLHAYGEAIDRTYRFYSYGDAMLIA